MKTADKDRLCAALMGVVELTPTLDPAQTLNALRQPQNIKPEDVPAMLDRVEKVKNHLYEASQMRTMMLVEQKLSREELFRLAYVPFVVAELVWDYADTVVCTSARLGSRATRNLSRMVRRLRERYDHTRYRFIGPAERNREVDNSLIFEETIKNHSDQLLMHIRLAMKNETPNLLPEWRTMFTAVYQCHVLSRALMVYTTDQEAKVSKRIGHHIHRMLPPECYALDELLPEYFGDMPPSQSFTKILEQYSRTFAAQMSRMEFEKENE